MNIIYRGRKDFSLWRNIEKRMEVTRGIGVKIVQTIQLRTIQQVQLSQPVVNCVINANLKIHLVNALSKA